jgi:cell wall-associated NlpC family hydrolase
MRSVPCQCHRPRWGYPPPRPPLRVPLLALLVLAALGLLFVVGPNTHAAGRLWADITTRGPLKALPHPKLQLPKLEVPQAPRAPGASRHRPARSARPAVAFARAQLGKPYVWGANGPGAFDCSGLAYQAWVHAGLGWPDLTAAEQYAWLRQHHAAISGGLQPGDLVFYATDRADPATIHHVAIVAGRGQMVEAPGAGEPVRSTPVRGGYLAARPGLVG